MTLGMYDVALLMANVSQLKSVLDYGGYKYNTAIIILLGVNSIGFHFISAILLYVMFVIDRNAEIKCSRSETIPQHAPDPPVRSILNKKKQSVILNINAVILHVIIIIQRMICQFKR